MATAEENYDLLVIGAGPGGYVAAIRAAQLGLKTACVEKEGTLGGTCLNVGCIPSKALLDSTELLYLIRHKANLHGIRIGDVQIDLAAMMRRKEKVVSGLTKGVEYLFKKNGVDWLRGTARLLEPTRVEMLSAGGQRSRIAAKNVLIATGSFPVPFPGVPFDEERVLSSSGALSLPEVPEHLIVIGGGPIGLELGSVWLRLGAKVTVLEMMPSILPGMDQEIVKMAERILRRQGFEFRTGVRVQGIEKRKDGVVLTTEGQQPLTGDRVLVAMGRRPYTEGLGLTEIGVKLNPKGAVEVDDRYRTAVDGVSAIGDVVGGLLLAHKASEEGVAAVENLVGKVARLNYDAVAGVVYTAPEIAAVGRTEAELQAEGRDIKVGRFPFSANSRARTLEDAEGMVKILADARTDRVLGVHILGPHASDLIAEAALAMEFEASTEDIAITVHAHPTLPEALKEAALGALGRPLNA